MASGLRLATPEAKPLATDLRRGAFEAGLLAVAAACLYALALVVLRAGGANRAAGAGVCVALLVVLAVVRRDPAAAYAWLRRRPVAIATATGALLGVGLALAGTGGTLLFLPAALGLATVGAIVPPRAVALGAALAAAGQLSVLALGDPTPAEARLAAAVALGVVAIPLALSALVAHFAGMRSAPPVAQPRVAADAQPGSFAASPPAPVLAPAAPLAATGTQPPTPAALALSPAATLLTPRQREVVALTRAGLRHGEIAERLEVSVQQVRRLLRQARERTGTSTTRELTAWSIAAGLPAPMAQNPSETQARLRDD